MSTERRRGRFVPGLEMLETRLVLSGSPWLLEPFDGVDVGTLPSGWTQWSSRPGGNFAVAAGTSRSPTRALASTVQASNTTSRAWVEAEVPADVEVGAAVYLNSLVPMKVFLRGRNLDTSTPSYYAVSLTRGLELKLQKVVDGVKTNLATINSVGYFSGEWVKVSLSAVGDHFEVRLQRGDNDNYLNSSGRWQVDPVSALSATDASLADGGQVGLNRAGSYTGRVTVDDFQVDLHALVEPFDDAPAGGLPADWSQWSSAGGTPFRVDQTRPLAGSAGLSSSAASSQASSRTWVNHLTFDDTQVSAALSLMSLAPGGLIVRGQDLDTTAPSYYALRATRGLELELVRVEDGVGTQLARLTSASYFSGPWVRLTLYANGDNLRGQVFRTDTNQYLNASGQWQSSQAWAINITDDGLPEAGLAGIERAARYTGALYWDDFSIFPATGDSQAPAVAITQPAAGATLTGLVTVRADASDNVGVNKVEFYLDGVLQSVDTVAPYQWEFDSSIASNDTHTLSVQAYDVAGNIGLATRDVITSNDTSVTRPDIPRHYNHIRVAMLAYTGTPFGTLEQRLLRESVDLVVSAPGNLSTINQHAPNTPRLVYSNVSNLYLELLTDWLAYADARGHAREAAFYHAAAATPFTGNSPSSQPVAWFWSVMRGGPPWTNYTSQARGTGTGGVPFGGVGTSVYAGYPDRFRELNVVMQTAASGGWSSVIEYPTAVDAAGQPTAWATLPLLGNTTAGLTRNGQTSFDPPANWKAASVNGSARLFFVRYRTTTAGTAPVVRTILGRDYVNAQGTTSGVIPAFDAAADANGDGYLNATEYGNRAAGKDARFSYESRLFHGSYGQMRFTANPSSLGFREWAGDYHLRLLAAQPLASGFFMDNSAGTVPISPSTAVEPTASYTNDFAATLNAIARRIAPKWVMANTVGGGNTSDAVIRRVQAYYEEFVIRPLSHNHRQFEDVATLVARRLALRSPAPYAVLDSYPSGGSPTDGRTQLATLAYYYLLADPVSTFLNFYGGYEPATSWSRHWTEAAAYDVGQPRGTWSQFATGADPSNTTLTYKVYQRDYDNALVLYKPLSVGGSVTGGTGTATATTHVLNGTYRVLQADGTLGATVTSVTLRNGEGAILIKT